uniref:Uncharacterized protein n=1 Tax=Meloidogyne enterolobii TaxID=390850 RepID=A0A6V7VCW6_MELEN|nr:unnamed protein product [Meloidogyne enterolobii]
MTEDESSSNSDLELKVIENEIQIKFVEEKTFYLEKKNSLLEDQLKEMDKKIQKINCDHKNEIEEMKKNFQKLFEEDIKQLKAENDQKGVKINSLEEEIKKVNDLFDKKICDLIIKLNDLKCNKSVEFIEIKNKWIELYSEYKCCENNCVNTNNPIGDCIKGNGFGNIIDDEKIKYIEGKAGLNSQVRVYAENSFKKPKICFNYSLYYFEVKSKFEGELGANVCWMNIGLKNLCTNKHIWYSANANTIHKENENTLKLENISWIDNDIFGCGLVYPPTTNKNGEFPYIFFTQNGKQIGKGVLLKDNFDLYKPSVYLKCYSVEANFGNNLKSKPFKYDILKHLILKEFY